MKILKSGKSKSKLLRGKCSACGSVIECNKSECESRASVFGVESYYVHQCPTKGCDNKSFMHAYPWELETPRERDEKMKGALEKLEIRVGNLERKR